MTHNETSESTYRRNVVVFCGEEFTASEMKKLGIGELAEHCSARQVAGFSHIRRPFKDEESARKWLDSMAGSCSRKHVAYLVTEAQLAHDIPVTEAQRAEGFAI